MVRLYLEAVIAELDKAVKGREGVSRRSADHRFHRRFPGMVVGEKLAAGKPENDSLDEKRKIEHC